ncbi:F-box protein, partial [Haematococcus lacustris]
MEAVASQFGSSLTRLDVSGCGQVISDKGVQALATAAPNLRLLDLSCSAVTDKGLRALLDGCPELLGVELSGCRGIDRGLRHAAAEAKALGRAAGQSTSPPGPAAASMTSVAAIRAGLRAVVASE